MKKYMRPAIKTVAAENGKLLDGSVTETLPSGGGVPGTFGAKQDAGSGEVWLGI